MKITQSLFARLALLSALAALVPSQSFAIGISPGSNSTAGLGNTANAVVRISAGGFVGSGTVLKIQDVPGGGKDLLVLTADHVVRNAAGGGSTLYAPSQISVGFGNQGGGGASFASEAVATDFTLPQDGSSRVDLAMLDVFIPGSQLNMLPANLAAVSLPGAAPAANSAITQAGYGLQGTVVTVSGNLAYVFSTPNGWGADYGTLAAGPNTVNGAGITAITGALSAYPGGVDGNGHPLPANFAYEYDGYQNGAQINGAFPNYNNSTSYIFSGDSGGPSLSGNTIVGVHSSSVTGTIQGDNDSEFAYRLPADANYLWQDVSVFDNLPWINGELANLSPVPEPTTLAMAVVGLIGLMVHVRRARRS